MKKFLYASTLAFLFVTLCAVTVSADTTTDWATSRRELMKENISDKRALWHDQVEERKAFWEERRAEFAGKLEAIRAERINGWLRMIGGRFDHAITFLSNIADRLEERIELLEDELDTTLVDARTHLDAARDHISEASDIVDGIPGSLEEALNSETPKEALGPVRTMFADAKMHIKEAHAELRAVVAAVKEATPETE